MKLLCQRIVQLTEDKNGKMTVSATEKLKKFYNCFERDDHVLVMINADPDAIASAMAVKRLLWRRTARVDICSISTIKRPDNVAMVEFLGVKIIKPEEIKKDYYSRFVIVDSQPGHNELFQKFTYDVIIDHHPRGEDEAIFKDIRPEYGATASMMVEYIKASGLKPAVNLSTGLFIGIRTDTDGFTRHSVEADMIAFRYVFNYVNKHLVSRIEHAEIRPGYLKFFQKAIGEGKTIRGKRIAHLGHVSTPDICVMIADFFMKVTNVRWSIISGVSGKKLVVIFRSDGVRRDCGKVAFEAFGDIGSAGGHKGMARAEIPVEALTEIVDVDDEKKTTQWVVRKITRTAE